MVERLFLAVPRGCLQFVIVVFPDHTHLLFFKLNQHVLRIALHLFDKYLFISVDYVMDAIVINMEGLSRLCHDQSHNTD